MMDSQEITKLQEQLEQLQLKVTRSLAIEQQLINSRFQLDQELQRFRSIYHYGQLLGKCSDMEHFAEILAESVVDIFEIESSIVWFSKDGIHLNPTAAATIDCGISTDGCSGLRSWLEDHLLTAELPYILRSEKGLKKHPNDVYDRLIAANIVNSEGICLGVVVGFVSTEKKDLYEVDMNDCEDSFGVLCHLSSTLYQNHLDNITIQNQNIQLEAKIATQARELIQQEKLASLGTLAAGVAHEINNPVGFIKSNVTVLADYSTTVISAMNLLRDLFDGKISIDEAKNNYRSANLDMGDLSFIPEDLIDLLQQTTNGIERVTKIVDGLRRFSHPSNNKRSATNINDCIEAAISVTTNKIKHLANLNKSLGELQLVAAIESELTQVFVNILINASQALGGKFGEILVSSWQEDNWIYASIQDNGIGIHEKHLSQLFEPFFTTKPVGEGTGLGLSISHGIMQDHGGLISVQSSVGHGTTFTLKFPAMSETT